MSEAQKTLTFCGVAVATAALATFVAWPSATQPTDEQAGKMLFAEFKDPLAASSLKIVTFDEEQGTMDTFEVRKDRETDLWTIPSREGYPADAIEQMKVAANALVDVKILDVQTTNAEDHDDLGVVEPKMETLEVGDEGVGRLVTFRGDKDVLASLIIGDAVKDDASKRYVRIPNQDPVYVIKFDDSVLTTNFTDWIEDDLLQLSSIDIDQVEIKDYTASLGQRGISLNRRYTAVVNQDNNDWKLGQLLEFDPNDPRKEGVPIEFTGEEKLNETKLNEMKNALDDLKIVSVFRKPDGVSETLKASKSLLSDDEAIRSLAQRGFYPIDVGPDGSAEILSANGELSVSLEEGVRYLLRFGNIAGVSENKDDSEEGEKESGVNRYLFVTTMVDQAKFPTPELQPVPQSLEELDAMMAANAAAEEAKEEEDSVQAERTNEETESQSESDAAEDPEAVKDGDMKPEESAMDSGNLEEANAEASNADETVPDESDAAEAIDGATEASGEGEASGSGQALQEVALQEMATQDDASEPTEVDQIKEGQPDNADGNANEGTVADSSEAATVDQTAPAVDAEDATQDGLTDEERQEFLEATQEKITKANQRLLDERKDRMANAEKKVRELNARFADWYYVIPETTYAQLRISQEDLFNSDDDGDEAPAMDPMQGGPQLQMPGFPGGGN